MDWTDATLVALIVGLLQGLKQIQWVADRTKILPLAAIVLGIVLAGLRVLCWTKAPVDLTVLVTGSLLGSAAIAAYSVATKSIAPLLAKDGTPPAALALLFLLPLAAGCQAETRYVLDATAEGAKSLDAVELGIQESRAGLATRLGQEESAIFAAYQADLASLVGKAIGKTVTQEEAAAKLVDLAGKYQRALAVTQVDRSRAAERFNRMLEHTALLRGILAQVYNLEQSRATADQKLQDFKVLAANYAAQKFGLSPTIIPSAVAPPAPAGDAGEPVPAVVTKGDK
jgi:hypothetical protein